MNIQVNRYAVFILGIVWFSFLAVSFYSDLIVSSSYHTEIVLSGEVVNSSSLGNGFSSFTLIKTSNPSLGINFPINDSVSVSQVEVIVSDGQTVAIHEISDMVNAPYLHEPEVRIWQEIYVDGILSWSGEPTNRLFQISISLFFGSVLLIVTLIILQWKYNKDKEMRISRLDLDR
ncbi:hypothetical protein CL614_04110 [archaeon]|nr:hypothetical protein [archaeon]